MTECGCCKLIKKLIKIEACEHKICRDCIIKSISNNSQFVTCPFNKNSFKCSARLQVSNNFFIYLKL